MDINEIKEKFTKGPYIVDRTNLNLLRLDDIHFYEKSENFDYEIDNINKSLPTNKKILINNDHSKVSRRIPFLNINRNITRIELNKIVSKNYDTAKQLLLNQSNLYKRILKVPDYETIFLIIVDGLSYERAKRYFDCEPILVDGITKTKNGMNRIVGEDYTLPQRIIDNGRENVYGYSYWSREENPEITKPIFSPIPEEDFYVYKEFNEVISDLETKNLDKGYIQIISNGLDNICHKYRDKPPIDFTLEKLKKNLMKIEDLCRKKNIPSTIFMTSDHGILWEKDNNFEIYDDFNLKDKGKRYTSGKILRDITKVFEKENYTAFKFPYITSKIKRTEWGVHGGLSYEENIIPLIKKEV